MEIPLDGEYLRSSIRDLFHHVSPLPGEFDGTASAPVFMGRTMSKPNMEVSFLAKGPRLEEWNAREERVSLDAWVIRVFTGGVSWDHGR